MNSSLVTALSEASWNSLNLEHPQEARCNPTRLCKTYWKFEARRTPFRVVLKLDCTQSNCEATPHPCTTNRINNKSIIEKSNVKARSGYDNIHQKISPFFLIKKRVQNRLQNIRNLKILGYSLGSGIDSSWPSLGWGSSKKRDRDITAQSGILSRWDVSIQSVNYTSLALKATTYIPNCPKAANSNNH